jgi:histidinol-phosphate aminotransferase
VIRFDHNTSPFPTDWVPPLLAAPARTLNEYPAASYAALRVAAASYYSVVPEQVVPGAGVDELLLLIGRAFLGPGRRGSAATPTYPLYEIATLQTGAEFRTVPYGVEGFRFPAETLGAAAETSDVTWLCVPSNPTGERQGDDDVRRIIEAASGIVVVDAAYAEFSRDRWAAWVNRYDHVIVCHTLSKGFGLAGIRVGFALAHPDLIDRLDGVRPPGSVPSLSASLALTALETPSRMERHVDRIIANRTKLEAALAELGIAVVPGSATNFLLCELGDQAHALADALMEGGLVVRRFPEGHPLNRFLRFTVRSRDENQRLIDDMRSLT